MVTEDQSDSWRGIKVRNKDGRSGKITEDTIYIDGARDLWVQLDDHGKYRIRLSGRLDNWKKDASVSGWEWWCRDYCSEGAWLSFET